VAYDDYHWTAWAAGFFEGEGCITAASGAHSKRGNIALSVSNSDLSMLERFRDVVGVGAIYEQRAKTTPGRRQMWAWNLWNQREVDQVCDRLWTFLSERRRTRIVELRYLRAEAIMRALRPRECPTCHCEFCPMPGNSATAKVYCSKRCRDNAPYKRERYRAKHKAAQRRYVERKRLASGLV